MVTNTFPVFRSAQAKPATALLFTNSSGFLGISPPVVRDNFVSPSLSSTPKEDTTVHAGAEIEAKACVVIRIAATAAIPEAPIVAESRLFIVKHTGINFYKRRIGNLYLKSGNYSFSITYLPPNQE